MDSEIRKYCKHIAKKHTEVLRKNKNTGVWFWDLPAAASICYSRLKGKKIQHRGYAHIPQGTKWNHVLRKIIEKLGEIGKTPTVKPKGEKIYILGNCAEQHAGNNLMNKYNIKDLKSLYFSECIRPRTMEHMPPCYNCRHIFPNL